MRPSVLVVTIPPLEGGVPAKTRILVEYLRARGHPVTVAHYATLSDYPDLAAPSWRLARGGRPAARSGVCFDGVPSVAVGCALPEFEFTYYLPSVRWRRVIAAHQRHIAVGGTVMVSYPLTALGIPHLVWCASTMGADRADRRRAMPAARRAFDRAVVGPVQRCMERRILAGPGRFLTVSTYTRRTLLAAGGRAERFAMLPVPVDPRRFTPPAEAPRPGVIGFAGRANDPRKNVHLLFEAVRRLAERGSAVELRLTGEPVPDLERAAAALGIAERVRWLGWLPEDGLAGFYRSLDVFVIPSFQEGLNIAGLQAMACGVPVISTRCGGPEDYVVEGETGFLVDADAGALAEAVGRVVADRAERADLGAGARRKAEADYSPDAFGRDLGRAWQDLWGERPWP